MDMRTRTRLFATALATLMLVVALGAGGPAAASGESPSVTHRLLATVGDLLDVATYEVHTRFTNADGTTTDRSTPAVVGVPELVNVNRGLPDLAVTVTPLADRLRLSIDKLPTASSSLPVLVEAVFDLPGGLGGPERDRKSVV
jgi:hypothetical protein